MIRKISVFLFSLLMLVVVIAIMSLNATKNILSKESIQIYINSSDVLNLPIGQVFDVPKNVDENSTIKDSIIIMALDAGIPKSIVDDLVESNELSNLLADFVKSTIDYAIIGEDRPYISNEARKSLINNSEIILENHIDIVMENDELHLYVDKYIDSLNKMVPNRNLIMNDTKGAQILGQAINFNSIYLYSGFIVLFALIWIVSKKVYLAIKNAGIVITISGILFTIIGCLEWPIFNLLKGKFLKIENIFHELLNQVLSICFKEGVIYTTVGVALIVLGFLIMKFSRNKKLLEETRRYNIEDIKL